VGRPGHSGPRRLGGLLHGPFGWETEANDTDNGFVYTTCSIDGDTVCGIFVMSEEMRARGVPPSWTSYVTVADADAAAARASSRVVNGLSSPSSAPDGRHFV
jgi:predicted enzyme related to lactoylglutathione lyase